jgi:hypothetical protein
VVFRAGFRDLMPPVTNWFDTSGIRSLADGQHGVVDRAQLLRLGLHRQTIANWLVSGRLAEVYPGAYAPGHSALKREGYWMAAVLSCGPGAVLSHRAAAALHGLGPSARSEMTTTRNVARTGFRVHRVRELPLADRAVANAIPCTSPMRTLADLAGTSTPRQIERLLDNAHFRGLLDLEALGPILDARRRRKSTSTLMTILRSHAPGTSETRSSIEEAFLGLVDGAGLPRPALNVPLVLRDGTHIAVDALWPRPRLIAEVDHPHTHMRATSFESDRRRDAHLQLEGYTVLRFTDRQIAHDAAYVTATLRQALRQSSGNSGWSIGEPAGRSRPGKGGLVRWGRGA